MKKILILLAAILLVAFLIGAPIAYAEEIDTGEPAEEEAFDWVAWFKDEAAPFVIAFGTGLIAFLIAFAPVFNGIKAAVKLFKNSKEEYDGVAEKVVNTQLSITDFKDTSLAEMKAIHTHYAQELEKIREQNSLVLDAQKGEIRGIKKEITKLARIAKIGFCNSEELVKNGYANEIMKVEVEDEDTQTEMADIHADNI